MNNIKDGLTDYMYPRKKAIPLLNYARKPVSGGSGLREILNNYCYKVNMR
jgi:hypothetical protein